MARPIRYVSWTGLVKCLYAFPPVSVVSKVLQNLRDDVATALLFLPLWSSQVFLIVFQFLAASSLSSGVTLPAVSHIPSGTCVGLDSAGALWAAFTRHGLSSDVTQVFPAVLESQHSCII